MLFEAEPVKQRLTDQLIRGKKGQRGRIGKRDSALFEEEDSVRRRFYQTSVRFHGPIESSAGGFGVPNGSRLDFWNDFRTPPPACTFPWRRSLIGRRRNWRVHSDPSV